jgi:hypothetical protein
MSSDRALAPPLKELNMEAHRWSTRLHPPSSTWPRLLREAAAEAEATAVAERAEGGADAAEAEVLEARDWMRSPQKLSWLRCKALLCLSYGMLPKSIWKRHNVSPSSCRLRTSSCRCSGVSIVAKLMHKVCRPSMILLSFLT